MTPTPPSTNPDVGNERIRAIRERQLGLSRHENGVSSTISPGRNFGSSSVDQPRVTLNCPREIILEITMPEPTPLPNVEDMTPVDIVRELVSVSTMRRAETIAALDYVDKSTRSLLSDFENSNDDSIQVEVNRTSATPSKQASIDGTLDIGVRKWLPLHPDVIFDATESKMAENKDRLTSEILATWSYGGNSDPLSDAIDTPYFQPRTSATISIKTNFDGSPTLVTMPLDEATHMLENGSDDFVPTVRIVLNISSALSARIVCYELPNALDSSGAPRVGPSAAKDAISVLKHMLTQKLHLLTKEYSINRHDLVRCIVGELLTTSKQGSKIDALKAELNHPDLKNPVFNSLTSILKSCVRVYVHSHLTPAQSESRVQCLIARIKELTGYEYTPPWAPLAQTRLGSAHVVEPHHSTNSVGEQREEYYTNVYGYNAFNVSSPAPKAKSNSMQECNGTATASMEADKENLMIFRTPPPTTLSRRKEQITQSLQPTPVVLGTPRPRRLNKRGYLSSFTSPPTASRTKTSRSVTFNITRGAANAVIETPVPVSQNIGDDEVFEYSMEAIPIPPAPILFSPTTGNRFKPLFTPNVTLASRPSTFTPERSNQRALARYISSMDVSRVNASPASYDRNYHMPVLSALQIALQSMNKQRKDEEAHMLASTGVRPSRNPRGGYIYTHELTGVPISVEDYTRLYLAEIHYASDFIDEQAMRVWAVDAQERMDIIRNWDERTQNKAILRHNCAKQVAMSWWDQPVEEGFNALLSKEYVKNVLSQYAQGQSFPIATDCENDLTLASLLKDVVLETIARIKEENAREVASALQLQAEQERVRLQQLAAVSPQQSLPQLSLVSHLSHLKPEDVNMTFMNQFLSPVFNALHNSLLEVISKIDGNFALSEENELHRNAFTSFQHEMVSASIAYIHKLTGHSRAIAPPAPQMASLPPRVQETEIVQSLAFQIEEKNSPGIWGSPACRFSVDEDALFSPNGTTKLPLHVDTTVVHADATVSNVLAEAIQSYSHISTSSMDVEPEEILATDESRSAFTGVTLQLYNDATFADADDARRLLTYDSHETENVDNAQSGAFDLLLPVTTEKTLSPDAHLPCQLRIVVEKSTSDDFDSDTTMGNTDDETISLSPTFIMNELNMLAGTEKELSPVDANVVIKDATDGTVPLSSSRVGSAATRVLLSPSFHNIVSRRWNDANQNRVVNATDDPVADWESFENTKQSLLEQFTTSDVTPAKATLPSDSVDVQVSKDGLRASPASASASFTNNKQSLSPLAMAYLEKASAPTQSCGKVGEKCIEMSKCSPSLTSTKTSIQSESMSELANFFEAAKEKMVNETQALKNTFGKGPLSNKLDFVATERAIPFISPLRSNVRQSPRQFPMDASKDAENTFNKVPSSGSKLLALNPQTIRSSPFQVRSENVAESKNAVQNLFNTASPLVVRNTPSKLSQL